MALSSMTLRWERWFSCKEISVRMFRSSWPTRRKVSSSMPRPSKSMGSNLDAAPRSSPFFPVYIALGVVGIGSMLSCPSLVWTCVVLAKTTWSLLLTISVPGTVDLGHVEMTRSKLIFCSFMSGLLTWSGSQILIFSWLDYFSKNGISDGTRRW